MGRALARRRPRRESHPLFPLDRRMCTLVHLEDSSPSRSRARARHAGEVGRGGIEPPARHPTPRFYGPVGHHARTTLGAARGPVATVGIEPTTPRVSDGCSAIELDRHDGLSGRARTADPLVPGQVRSHCATLSDGGLPLLRLAAVCQSPRRRGGPPSSGREPRPGPARPQGRRTGRAPARPERSTIARPPGGTVRGVGIEPTRAGSKPVALPLGHPR